jgi:two-component system response regulator AtoC
VSENASSGAFFHAARNPAQSDQWVFGFSSAMRAVRERAEKIAKMDIPVLIEGPGGSGKEVLARWIHERSSSRSGQFVKCNCAAIPSQLLESELFGYERGAFTGANKSKPGRVEMAQGGTLFLDEVGELDLLLQAKLLHVLQDGRFSRIGDLEEKQIQARMIFATNKDLWKEASAGRFRADLFYRINVIRIEMPPLKYRREDIPMLVEYFLSKFNDQFERAALPLSRETMRYLQEREWVGNIRELENCIARYVVLGAEEVLLEDPLEPSKSDKTERNAIPLLKHTAKRVVRETERKLILKALQQNCWNRRRTAQALNISYRALMYKLRETKLVQKRHVTHGAPQSTTEEKSSLAPE